MKRQVNYFFLNALKLRMFHAHSTLDTLGKNMYHRCNDKDNRS